MADLTDSPMPKFDSTAPPPALTPPDSASIVSKSTQMFFQRGCQHHSSIALTSWGNFIKNIRPTEPDDIVTRVNGYNLDVAGVVAVARHGAAVSVDSHSLSRLTESRMALEASLDKGMIIYGVNTGFGGSADTRTDQVERLQSSLIRMLQYGVLATPEVRKDPAMFASGFQITNDDGAANGTNTVHDDPEISGKDRFNDYNSTKGYHSPLPLTGILNNALPLEDPFMSTCMPEAWVRAAILIRINSLVHGHSAIRPAVVERLLDLLQQDIVPRIPLHGSISASGDLSPLSYISGVIQGEDNMTVWTGNRNPHHRYITTASQALSEAHIEPIKLAAKEGLAIVNGTALSAAVGALAIHDAHGLAVVSQVLTAMCVEAMCGTSESFDPFFAEVRPHPGQVESAHNIYNFLTGSKLASSNDGSDADSLRQDRYSLRTASQWIGPVLEDLVLAHQQVTVECNSVTDNPLITPEGKAIHGGNFQAKAITSAMEKTRQGIQSLGRMLFAQCTELINPATNHGLPPNLVPDEPSQSFLMKGVDIMVAALQAELGFLANPVNHVQTAEMGNQALNSLALISARYTHTALEILSKLVSAYLLALCQALDLRAMHERFLDRLHPQFQDLSTEVFLWMKASMTEAQWDEFSNSLWHRLIKKLDRLTTSDTNDRFNQAVSFCQALILESAPHAEPVLLLHSIRAFTSRCPALLSEIHSRTRASYFEHGDARPLLGPASKRMYTFVRDHLGVPFITTQDLQTPPKGSEGGAKEVPTIGSLITKIYTSIRSGQLYVPAMECLEEATSYDVYEDALET